MNCQHGRYAKTCDACVEEERGVAARARAWKALAKLHRASARWNLIASLRSDEEKVEAVEALREVMAWLASDDVKGWDMMAHVHGAKMSEEAQKRSAAVYAKAKTVLAKLEVK